MKKTKLYAKKALSVFMAIMMLMTAWVFVAPEKASAASVSYPVKVKFSHSGSATGHVLVYYFTVNDDGTIDTSNTEQYSTVINSFVNDGYSASGTYTAGTFDIPGWPWKVSLTGANNKSLRFLGFYIGDIEVTGMVANGNEGYTIGKSTKHWAYNDNTNLSSGSIANKNWDLPYISSLSTPENLSFTVPKINDTSEVTKSTSSTAYDQYGVAFPFSSGISYGYEIANNSATGYDGISYTESISSGKGTFTMTINSDAQKNLPTGQTDGKITYNIWAKYGDSVTSSKATVTLQCQPYNAYLYYYDGSLAKTYSNIGYYNQNAAISDLPANSAPTQISGDDSYHQPYEWPAGITNSYLVQGDKSFTEVAATKATHSYGDWSQGETSHSRTCSVCGYVQTQAHIQSTTGYQTKAETCTEDGVMTYDCSVCGKTAVATSVIDKITGHDFSGDIVMNVDGKDGSHWRKCVRFAECGAYGWSGVENDCENHIWDKNADNVVDASDGTVTVEPKCLTTGTREYTCSKCDASYTEEIAATGHQNVTATAAKDVTTICGGHGYKAFWTCSDCGKIYTDSACTTEITDYVYTEIDGKQIPTELVVNGPDHDFSGACVSTKDGADGTHYRQCTRFTQCGAYGLNVENDDGTTTPTVDATEGHNFTSTETASTCTKAGTKTYTCSDCKSSYKETLALAAHTMEKIEAVPATCTEGGNNEYYKCTVCSNYYKDEAGTTATTVAAETVTKLGHTFAAGNSDTQQPESDTLVAAATCQAAAVYKVHCDRCGIATASTTYSYGNPDTVNGHQFNGAIQKNSDGTHSYKCTVEGCNEDGNATKCEYEVTADVASTCKTAGYTTYVCKTCKNGYSDTKALDTANHNGEGTYIIGAQPSTCHTNGSTGVEKCSGCNAQLSSKLNDLPVDPANHEAMQDYEARTATCQTAGWKAYRYCSACDTYETEKVVVEKKAHTYTKYISNGDGTHTATCTTCDAAVATPVTDTKDCSGGTANCVDKALCTVCGEEYGDVDSENHKTIETVKKVDSTCQTEGTEAYRKCTACTTNIETPVVIEKKAHTYSAWTKIEDEDKHTRYCTTCDADVAEVATETEACKGGAANCVDKAKCEVCKAEYGSTNPAVHKTEANTLKDVVEATCQSEGFSGNYRYNCCDAVKEAGEVTEKLDHTFDIEVEDSRVDATCIAKGEVTYKCSTCVESDGVTAATNVVELPIDAKNHASEETITVGAKDATCEEDGHTGDIYYACCYNADASAADNKKALKQKGQTIKANGQHVFADAIPEYMIEEITESTDDEGNVTQTIVVKATEPTYEEKIAARHTDDDKWYHAEQCTICGTIVYGACYTYEHTYNCVDTDICEVCDGLCSLRDTTKHDNLVEIPKVEATHTTDGTRAYYMCADCGKYFLDDAGKKEFDPTSDEGKALIVISKDTVPCTDWETEPFETMEPTCGEDGYKKYHCTIEGCDKVKTEVIEATSDSHTWSVDYEIVKEPTCGAVGYKSLYCTVCDAVKPNSTVTIAATGEHNYELAETDEGTSCLDPTIETYICSGCGAEKTETVYDEQASHIWSDWATIGGDCSTGIVQQRECTICHETEQQTVTSDTHDYKVTLLVEPTPEKDGYQIETCANCGDEKRTELPYMGTVTEDDHLIVETEYTIAEYASCAHGEIRRYICLRCGETVEKEIEGTILEHVWLEQAEEIATCERDGHSSYYRCVRCLAEYGEGKVVYPATGHADTDDNGKCDRCNSAYYGEGENSGTCGCICHKEGWFMQLIYKIISFFWKLFKIGHSCDCGATHY